MKSHRLILLNGDTPDSYPQKTFGRKLRPVSSEQLSRIKKTIVELLIVFFVSTIATIFYFRSFHPTIPIRYVNDEMSYLAIFKVMWENATPLPWSTTINYGAPLGTNELDYPMSDNFHFFLIYLLVLVFKNVVLANNVYYLLTFLLTPLIAYFVLREFNIPQFIALPGALSYSFLPYHILRANHLFLASYYLIPLIVLLVYLVECGKINFFDPSSPRNLVSILTVWKRKVFWAVLILCLLYGSSGIYYAFFAFFLIILLAVKALLMNKLQNSLTHLIIAAMICLSVVINLAPSIIYRMETSPAAVSIGGRDPSESEIYGLKMIQMLLPTYIHQIDSFRELNKKYDRGFPNVNENSSSTLGIIGSTGFLLSLIFLFTPKREDPLTGFLGFANLSSFLLGTVGGIGTIFAFLIYSNIRSYNRISVFIAFLAISQFCLVVKDLYEKYSQKNKQRLIRWIGFFLLSGLVFFDQVWIVFPYDQSEIAAEYVSDQKYVSKIEAQLPDNAMIFQLPFMDYPEGSAVQKLRNYDHFRVFLHSHHLRWSYGAMKGRESAAWNQKIAKLPVEEMVTALSVSNFSGIHIDRTGYADEEWIKLETELSDLLGIKPIFSSTTRMVFFDLQPFTQGLKKRMSDADWQRLKEMYGFVHIFKGEFSKPDQNGNYRLPCTGKSGFLTITNINENDLPARVSFDAVSITGVKMDVSTKSEFWRENLTVDDRPIQIDREISVSRVPLEIEFVCNAPNTGLASAESEEVQLQIENFTVNW